MENTNNSTTVTVKRKGRTRKNRVKVKTLTTRVNRTLAPAASDVRGGPSAVPATAPLKAMNALGTIPTIRTIGPHQDLIEIIRNQDASDPTRYDNIVELGTRLAARAEQLVGVHTSEGVQVTATDLAALSRGYLEALTEVRPMGGKLELLESISKPSAMKVAREAAAYYPSDWVAASASNRPMQVQTVPKDGRYRRLADPPRELDADEFVSDQELDGLTVATHGIFIYPTAYTKLRTLADGRHVYSAQVMNANLLEDRPAGGGWEQVAVQVRATAHRSAGISNYWVRPKHRSGSRDEEWVTNGHASLSFGPADSVVPEHGKYIRVAIHELAHRLGDSVPAINEAGLSAVIRRAGPDRRIGPLVGTPAKAKASGYDADFAVSYIGRVYADSDGTEMISCGAEAIFAGTYGGLIGASSGFRRDLETRAFVLGVMASL